MNNSTKLNSIKWLYYLSLRYYEIVYVYGLHVCTCTMFQKRLLGPCYWIYKWLWATMQVPGTKPGLPAKAARALYHWAMASPLTYILVTYFSISMTLDVIISSSHMQCCMNFLSKPRSLFLYVHVNLEIIESESLFLLLFVCVCAGECIRVESRGWCQVSFSMTLYLISETGSFTEPRAHQFD